MQRISVAVLALLLLYTPPVQSAASKTSPATISPQARTVVADQLSAFKTRNATQAYAATSQRFRDKYKSPLRFATMMRLNHWELYSHSAYKFIGPEESGNASIQKVEISTETGESFIYLFRLSKGTSGDWLIDNVIMLDPEAQPI